MTLSEIKRHLEARGLRPLARFGQNFLHDQNLAEWMVTESLRDFPTGENVVEIGPGLGAITGFLLQRGACVTAVEVDRGLAEFLRDYFRDAPGFSLLEGDALKVEASRLPVVRLLLGNLPYNISTPLLARFTEQPEPPERMVFTLQREVAERLAAVPRTKDYGALTVILQAEYKVDLLRVLPGDVFYPKPDVSSAVVRLQKRAETSFTVTERAAFRAFVKKGFSQRRKKLSNLLHLDESRRAEELSVAEWIVLWQSCGGIHLERNLGRGGSAGAV